VGVTAGVEEQLVLNALYPLLHVVPESVPPLGQLYTVPTVDDTVHVPPALNVPAHDITVPAEL
jgi:hypothetical protein